MCVYSERTRATHGISGGSAMLPVGRYAALLSVSCIVLYGVTGCASTRGDKQHALGSADNALVLDGLAKTTPNDSGTSGDAAPSEVSLLDGPIIRAAALPSRPDTLKIACHGEPAEYCAYPMVPHCHGEGIGAFCHSHPGGEYPHSHATAAE